ncbi:MAG: DUF2169 domain-containing protein [Kiloniellales bacterium]|nr:DUF2169 domain-containing protein [Kiloniellales bacterium]
MPDDAPAIFIPAEPPPTVADPSACRIVLPGQTPEGEYILGVLVKRSYDVVHGKRCARAEGDRPLIAGDQHFGDPMNSTVEFESDFVPFKLATDVVLNGRAFAPKGEAVTELTASLAVGQHRKDIVVIGDRMARHRKGQTPLFTDPEPFTEIELRYERAFGGIDIYSDRKLACPYARNHLGRGFAIRNIKEAVEGLPLPNIEDPQDRLTPERLCIDHFIHMDKLPMPQGFGWFLKYWRPRALLAGVMPADRETEQELRKIYRQAVPPEQLELYDQTELPDMDFRFFNGASQGLALPYLKGDEGIRLSGLAAEGDVVFGLPKERPEIGLDIGSGVQEPDVVLQTVMIRMEERQVDLVWRGAVPYPGPDWLPEMKRMEVLVT